MVKSKKYIDAQTFDGFKENQDKLIEILNHNISEIKNDVKSISSGFSEMKGSFKVTQRIIWWILGIFGGFVGLLIIGVLNSK